MHSVVKTRCLVVVVGALVVACGGGGRAQAELLAVPDDCPRFDVASDSWRTTQLYSLGVEIKLPAIYRRMFWERTSDTLTRRAEFRRREPPLSSVRLIDMSRDSARVAGPKRIPNAISCQLQTQSGLANVVIQGYEWPERQRFFLPAFEVIMQLPSRDANRAVLVLTSSMDSLGMKEHLAMARTMRLLSSP